MTEVRSQYDEALSIMGTLVQKAAIMVAISSMLLFELFRMQTSGIIYNIGLITLATDCIIGFFITSKEGTSTWESILNLPFAYSKKVLSINSIRP